MSDEEMTTVEETRTVEEEKAEVEETEVEVEEIKAVEESKVEEKVVEETKVEAKTDGNAKAGSVSEEAVEMLKAALPETLPLGTVLKINTREYYPNQPGTPSVNSQSCVIGLPDGNVGVYVPAGSAPSEAASVSVTSYEDLIEALATYTTGVLLGSAWCGCAMPSKDSIQFVANLTVVHAQDK